MHSWVWKWWEWSPILGKGNWECSRCQAGQIEVWKNMRRAATRGAGCRWPWSLLELLKAGMERREQWWGRARVRLPVWITHLRTLWIYSSSSCLPTQASEEGEHPTPMGSPPTPTLSLHPGRRQIPGSYGWMPIKWILPQKPFCSPFVTICPKCEKTEQGGEAPTWVPSLSLRLPLRRHVALCPTAGTAVFFSGGISFFAWFRRPLGSGLFFPLLLFFKLWQLIIKKRLVLQM